MVVERAGETELSVEIEVRWSESGSNASFERELSRATGEIHRALSQGRLVGLRLPAIQDQPQRHYPPSAGALWRRTLLEALAKLPRVA